VPQVDKEALERLIRDGDLRSSWPDLEPEGGDAAADILDKAGYKLRELRQEESLSRWFLVAVWIAGATVAAFYGNELNPVEGWYEWPLVWIGGAGLVGIALTVVYGATMLIQDFWWERFGDGRRGSSGPLRGRDQAARGSRAR
jgi:hypothetical protein